MVIPPKPDGTCAIPHGSIVKIAVTKNGKTMDKLSPWATYVTRPKDTVVYHQEFYNPPHKYQLKHPRPPRPESLRIYEAHVGISSFEGKVNTYRAFADDVIPRIAKQGWLPYALHAKHSDRWSRVWRGKAMNVLALKNRRVSINLHTKRYSRCGPPDDVKYLVDKAHSMGISILLDVVHSHASKNVADGLNEWDGTEGCYFHTGPRGTHTLWDSRLFDYTQYVVKILLSP
ncbi:unnamed protein product [Heligmosomoides polygyrus]|uniref:Aamy domain-containing protein n=1 Tax=Heligmosomoides polygyrus TaxID=6339 RepID=A0A183F7R4_HELPZ|nr:unnamed protein product [Heligmosomoides polygyrus]